MQATIAAGGGAPADGADTAMTDATAALNEALAHLGRVVRLDAYDFPGLARPSQLALLARLPREGGLRLTQLAEGLHCDLSVASRLTTTLVERGHVGRTRDPDDGRAWRFWLTPAGAALLEASRERRLHWLDATLADFTPAQRQVAADVIAALVPALRALKAARTDSEALTASPATTEERA